MFALVCSSSSRTIWCRRLALTSRGAATMLISCRNSIGPEQHMQRVLHNVCKNLNLVLLAYISIQPNPHSVNMCLYLDRYQDFSTFMCILLACIRPRLTAACSMRILSAWPTDGDPLRIAQAISLASASSWKLLQFNCAWWAVKMHYLRIAMGLGVRVVGLRLQLIPPPLNEAHTRKIAQQRSSHILKVPSRFAQTL